MFRDRTFVHLLCLFCALDIPVFILFERPVSQNYHGIRTCASFSSVFIFTANILHKQVCSLKTFESRNAFKTVKEDSSAFVHFCCTFAYCGFPYCIMLISIGGSSSHITVLTSGFIFIVAVPMLLIEILKLFISFLEQHDFFRKQLIRTHDVFNSNMW